MLYSGWKEIVKYNITFGRWLPAEPIKVYQNFTKHIELPKKDLIFLTALLNLKIIFNGKYQ
jgi:hypothetical protein